MLPEGLTTLYLCSENTLFVSESTLLFVNVFFFLFLDTWPEKQKASVMFVKKLMTQTVTAAPKQQLTKVRHAQRLYLLRGLLAHSLAAFLFGS
jgi:hypothetical protein